MQFVKSRRHCEALSYISLTCFIQRMTRRRSLKFYFTWRRKILKATKFKNSNSSFKVCRRDENLPQTSTNIWAHLHICSNINYLLKVNLPPAVTWQNRSRAVVMFGRIKVAMVTAALREDRWMNLWFSDSCSHKEKKNKAKWELYEKFCFKHFSVFSFTKGPPWLEIITEGFGCGGLKSVMRNHFLLLWYLRNIMHVVL